MASRTTNSAAHLIRRTVVALSGVLLLFSALLLHAGNLWENKPVEQWTFQEVTDFLEKSPWTQSVNVSSAYHMRNIRDPRGPRREVVRYQVWDPVAKQYVTRYKYVDVERPRVRRAKRFSYKVVWLSSRLVQEALEEQGRKGPTYLSWWWGPRDDLLVPDPSEQIVLLLVGPFLTMQATQESPADARGPTEFYLKLSGSDRRIPAESVRYLKGRRAALLTFPRELSGEEKHVSLHCKFQRLKFKKRFDLRRMGSAGSPDI